jgi:hypothetical protein
VEAESAYGERFDSTSFLVVGGEISPPESARPELLADYKKVIPHAFRMRRARHICGQ